MPYYLAFKEVWRFRGRFFLFSLVITLITILVLFISALADGLALANKEYLSKLDAELLVFQSKTDLKAATSRLSFDKLNDIRRIEGVDDVGAIGFSSGNIVEGQSGAPIDVSLIGVEAGKPGSPPVYEGKPVKLNRGYEVVVDANAVQKGGLSVGQKITIRTIQGTKEKYFNFVIAGITEPRQYLFQPAVFIPYATWDEIRPQATRSSMLVDLTSNVIAVRLQNPNETSLVSGRIKDQVNGVDVATIPEAIAAIPGFSAQQSTLDTQRFFTLLIGILVIGGFFQIQTLQKVPQIGVLKAIGASNFVVGVAVVTQIVVVTTFGVFLGTVLTLLLGEVIPGTVPIVFSPGRVALEVITLLLIGPAGGLVSVRLATRVEPLIALGLSQ